MFVHGTRIANPDLSAFDIANVEQQAHAGRELMKWHFKTELVSLRRPDKVLRYYRARKSVQIRISLTKGEKGGFYYVKPFKKTGYELKTSRKNPSRHSSGQALCPLNKGELVQVGILVCLF